MRGITVIRANHLEELRDHAVDWTLEHPLRPLEKETILVQSNGISQWLKIALAERDVAMGLDIMLPARFQWRVYRSMPGGELFPRHSPFDTDRLVWWLMRILPELQETPPFAPLRRFLRAAGSGADGPGTEALHRRYQLALRIADLFDQYQVYRADWLERWSRSEAVPHRGEGTAHHRWQEALWKHAVEAMPPPLREMDRGSVHTRFLRYLSEWSPSPGEDRPPGLPPRVLVFGITTLAEQVVEVLHGISRFIPVLVFLHSPVRDPLTPAGGEDGALENPLYAAWGTQGREYYRLLHGKATVEKDLFLSPGRETTLHRLQEDILENRPGDETRLVAAEGDRSLVFHVAHSALREVEILHDQLLDAFDRDPDLQPRDVMVMVPDISVYSALVTAVFGGVEPGDPRYIPFTISDQGPSRTDPVLRALETILSLPRSRGTLEEVISLLETPALARRFGFGEHQAAEILERARSAGIRWGIDGAHRERFGMPARADRNTWRFGLRRMLLGYATGDRDVWKDVAAMEGIGGSAAEELGRLSALVDQLQYCGGELERLRTPEGWAEFMRNLLHLFFEPRGVEETERIETLLGSLQHFQEACREAQYEEEIPAAVVRESWLGGAPLSRLTQRFFAGAVNVATLMPMRAIPFRMVCLLGMNDGEYPRQQSGLAFDLMQYRENRRPGDRSRREDDRYLFLEALLSARDRLYISWTGRSISDNSIRPPSVLVSRLRDYLGDRAEALTLYHPLQPFSREYFRPEGPFFSYAREWHESSPPRETAGVPVRPEQEEKEYSLRHLRDLLRAPGEVYLRERLRVNLDVPEADDIPRDEPFVLDGLEEWSLKDDLIRDSLAEPDRTVEEHLHRLILAGRMQSHPFDLPAREGIRREAEGALLHYRAVLETFTDTAPRSHRIVLSGSRGGVVLRDEVDGIRETDGGDLKRLLITASRVHDGHGSFRWSRLIRWWPDHLAAQDTGRPVLTVIAAPHGLVAFDPLPPDRARSILRSLVDLRERAENAPFLVTARAGCDWVAEGGSGEPEKAAKAARHAFLGTGNGGGEYDRSPSVQRLWPDPDAVLASEQFYREAEELYGPFPAVVRKETPR